MTAGPPESDDPFDSARARSLVEGCYPAPIARAFALAAARSRDDDATAAVDLAGILLRYLGLVLLRDLLARPETFEPETATLLDALKRPVSDGKWLEIARHGCATARARGGACETWPTIDADLVALVLDRGLADLLGEVVAARNRIVHDARQDLVPTLRRTLAAALTSLSGLRFHRVLVPREADGAAPGSYRATLHRGHAAPFPEVRLSTDAELKLGQPYLSRLGAPAVLSLYPCLIEAPCVACGGERELFFLSHREKGSVRALAPVTGHALDEAVAKAAAPALAQLVDRLEKRTGRLSPRRFDVAGDALVGRRRLAAGEVVDGRYRIARFIASGGMADVYEAADEAASGRPVALKLLPVEIARSEETLLRFIAEVKQARAIEDRHVVRYLDHGEDRGDHYLVLELAGGWPLAPGGVAKEGRARDLAQLITAAGGRTGAVPTLAETVALAIAADIASGLHALHEKGIVHRDLKPANVLLFTEGDARVAKVADFGVSRERGAETLTLTGFAVGTPEYMAPEQAIGRTAGAQAGGEADVYALGVILYEMLSGDVPFRGDTPLATAHRHTAEKPEWLRRRAPHASEALARLVMKCLRKDPKARYRSAAALYRDLRRLLDEPGADPVREAERETAGLGRGFHLGPYVLGDLAPQLAGPSGETLATLYEAHDARSGEGVRVGVLLPALEGSAEARRDALERMRMAVRVRHPALVAVLAVDEEHGYTYFAAERPRGTPLVRLGAMPPERIFRVVLQLAAGLLALERAGLAHGRVRPESVLVEEGGEGGGENPFLEEEQARPRLDIPSLVPAIDGAPAASDTVGLGAILAWLMTAGAAGAPGRSPESGGDLAEVAERALGGAFAGVHAFGEALASVRRRRLDDAERARSEARERETNRNLARVFDEKADRALEAADVLGAAAFLARSLTLDDARRTRDRLLEVRCRGGRLLWASPTRAGGGGAVAVAPDGRRFASGGADHIVRLWDVSSGRETALHHAHSDLIYGVAFAPDGRRIASAGRDRSVVVWDPDGGQPPRVLRGHEGAVTHVAFTPDGGRIASSSDDGTVRVWSAIGGPEALVLRGHERVVMSVAVSGDGRRIAAGGVDKTLRVFDLETGLEVRRINEPEKKWVAGVAFGPDGRVVAATAAGAVRIFDPATGAEAALLGRHEGWASEVGFLGDGARVFSAGGDGTVRVWDAATGGELLRLSSGSPVVSASASADGRLLVSLDDSGRIRLFDLGDGREIARLDGHAGQARSVSFSADGRRFVSGGADGSVRTWDFAARRELRALAGHESGVTSVVASPRDGRAASASGDGTVRIWDIESGASLLVHRHHAGRVETVCWAPDGRRVVSGGADGTLQLVDAATGERVGGSTGAAYEVNGVAFSPDARHVAAACDDGSVRVFDTVDRGEPVELKGHKTSARGVAFGCDPGRVASASREAEVRIFDLATREEVLAFPAHEGGAIGLAFNPDGSRLATAGRDRLVRVWDPASGKPLLSFRGHAGRVEAVDFHPDGRTLASASGDGTIRLWSLGADTHRLSFAKHTDRVKAIAFTPDGSRIVSASADRSIRVWTLPEGRTLLRLTLDGAEPHSVAVSPDGRLLACGASDQAIRVWDTASGAEVLRIAGIANRISLAFAPDGRLLAASGAGGERRIHLLDVATGNPVATLAGHTDSISALSFSPDGRLLASAGADGTTRVWDVAARAAAAILRGHADRVLAVAFSRDGRSVATGGLDRTARVFDVASTRESMLLRGHEAGVRNVAFSPDGRWLATGSHDGSVRIWDAATGHEIASVCERQTDVHGLAFSPDGAWIAAGGTDAVRLWRVDAIERAFAASPEALRAEVEGETGLSVEGLELASVPSNRLTFLEPRP